MVLIIGELCQENVDEIVLTCSALRSLVGNVTRDLQVKVALLHERMRQPKLLQVDAVPEKPTVISRERELYLSMQQLQSDLQIFECVL